MWDRFKSLVNKRWNLMIALMRFSIGDFFIVTGTSAILLAHVYAFPSVNNSDDFISLDLTVLIVVRLCSSVVHILHSSHNTLELFYIQVAIIVLVGHIEKNFDESLSQRCFSTLLLKLDGLGGDNQSSSDEGKGVDKLHFVDFFFVCLLWLWLKNFWPFIKGWFSRLGRHFAPVVMISRNLNYRIHL